MLLLRVPRLGAETGSDVPCLAALGPSPACVGLPSSIARMGSEEFSGLALGQQGILNNSQNPRGSAPNLHELELFCKFSG